MKIDITSGSIEKALETAKDFANKLVGPSAEELGLLLKDHIALWRWKTQIRILNKAKAYCEKNNITTKMISPKLLTPLLENASLEDDDVLQDKWAMLLGNMVDSEQNIENHVFPYLLSQISKNEFKVLEETFSKKNTRVIQLKKEREEFIRQRPEMEEQLKKKLGALNAEHHSHKEKPQRDYRVGLELTRKIRAMESEISRLQWKELDFDSKIAEPEMVAEDGLKEYEFSNLLRLGTIRLVTPDPTVHSNPVHVDDRDLEGRTNYWLNVDVELEVSASYYVLTQLGELFISACSERRI